MTSIKNVARTGHGVWSYHILTFTVMFFFFAIASLNARAYELWGQTNPGEINPECLKVEFEKACNKWPYRLEETNGRLIEAPYEDGCQGKDDQLIIAMMSFSTALWFVIAAVRRNFTALSFSWKCSKTLKSNLWKL